MTREARCVFMYQKVFSVGGGVVRVVGYSKLGTESHVVALCGLEQTLDLWRRAIFAWGVVVQALHPGVLLN